jgi:hypothetical protein
MNDASYEFGANANVLKFPTDNRYDLARVFGHGKQRSVPHDAPLKGECNEVGPRTDHVPHPFPANGVVERRKALEGSARPVGKIHLDEIRVKPFLEIFD